MRRPLRYLKRATLMLLLCVAIGIPFAPALARRVIRSRLQTMIATQLNARLEIDDLTYKFPYGVEVDGAQLMTDGPDARPLALLTVPHLSLHLARSPLRSGPLVIESLIVDRPAIHMVRLSDGLVGRRGLARDTSAPTAHGKNWKLSDMFQLRRLGLHDGQVVYEDKSLKNTRPLEWKNLNVDLSTVRETGVQYAFHLIADDSPLASLDAMGTADIDTLLLNLKRCTLTVNVDPTLKQSALPPEYQEALSALGVRGSLALSSTATLPVLDLQHSTYDTTVELWKASASVPQWHTQLNGLSTKIRFKDGGGRPSVEFANFDAASNTGSIHLAGGSIVIDPQLMTWSLSKLSGRIDSAEQTPGQGRGSIEFNLDASGPLLAPDAKSIKADLHLIPSAVSLRPPGMAGTIEQFAETHLSLSDGVLSAQGLRAGFGNDLWFIKSVRADLSKLPDRIDVADLQGCLTFGSPRATYPADVEKILQPLDPSGPWFFNGTARIGIRPTVKTDYRVLVHTARGRLAVTDHHIPIYNINTECTVTPAAVTISHFTGGILRGELKVNGTMEIPGDNRYDLRASARAIDLNQLVLAVSDPKKKPEPLGGHANLTAHLTGIIPSDARTVLDMLAGRGEFEVKDGDFWHVPVMQSIADNSNVRATMTVGEAAGLFNVSEGVVHLSHAAVSAPALGVEGAGSIDFKGRLNFDVITTVLGNWGSKFDIGDDGTFSRAVDQVEQTINGVAQVAVVNIHIDGTANKPEVHPVPAPFITKPTAQFVGFLKDKSQNGDLLGFVKNQPAKPAN
jgi:hypothetical protein